SSDFPQVAAQTPRHLVYRGMRGHLLRWRGNHVGLDQRLKKSTRPTGHLGKDGASLLQGEPCRCERTKLTQGRTLRLGKVAHSGRESAAQHAVASTQFG